MGAALQIRNGYACGKIDINVVFFPGGISQSQKRAGNPCFRLQAFGNGRACITGTGHGGKDELIDAVGGSNHFRIMQFNADDIAGHNVCHVHGKDIGPLLFKQGSAFPFAFSLLIIMSCFFLFLYFGSDDLIPDFHFHAMDGYSGGSRKDIGGVYRFLAFVGIGLSDEGFGKNAVDIYRHIGFLQREAVCRRIHSIDQKVWSESGVGIVIVLCSADSSRVCKEQ